MKQLFLPLLVLAACGGRAATPTPAPGGDDYATFVEDFFAARYDWQPSYGTAVGFHQYDQKLEDRSRARVEARIAELHKLKTRLATIDRAKLGFDDALD